MARGLRAANLVIAPTQAMLSALNQHYGPFPAGRVVPNGRDPTLITPGAKEAFVLTAGRTWDAAKNVVGLERIAPHLQWPVYVAGEGRHPDGGEAQPANVYRLGRLSPQSLASWFAHAAVYALPAYYEPFGLSALEAGLAGCALVLGDIPSLREIWEGAAVFISPNDPEALKAVLQELTRDPMRRKALAMRARSRAFNFTPQRMAQGYLDAYRDLLAGAPPTKRSEDMPTCAS